MSPSLYTALKMTDRRAGNAAEIRALIKDRSVLGPTAKDIFMEVCGIYGEGQITDSRFPWGLASFRAGRQ